MGPPMLLFTVVPIRDEIPDWLYLSFWELVRHLGRLFSFEILNVGAVVLVVAAWAVLLRRHYEVRTSKSTDVKHRGGLTLHHR